MINGLINRYNYHNVLNVIIGSLQLFNGYL